MLNPNWHKYKTLSRSLEKITFDPNIVFNVYKDKIFLYLEFRVYISIVVCIQKNLSAKKLSRMQKLSRLCRDLLPTPHRNAEYSRGIGAFGIRARASSSIAPVKGRVRARCRLRPSPSVIYRIEKHINSPRMRARARLFPSPRRALSASIHLVCASHKLQPRTSSYC